MAGGEGRKREPCPVGQVSSIGFISFCVLKVLLGTSFFNSVP